MHLHYLLYFNLNFVLCLSPRFFEQSLHLGLARRECVALCHALKYLEVLVAHMLKNVDIIDEGRHLPICQSVAATADLPLLKVSLQELDKLFAALIKPLAIVSVEVKF